VRREGDTRTQSALVIIERGPGGGVIVDGLLDRPEDPAGPRHEVEDRAGQDRSPAATARRLREALRYMVEAELALEAEAVPALAVLERALTGRNGGWPRPLLAVPGEIGAGAIEEEAERLREESRTLVDEFAAALEEQASQPALRERGPDIASLMLDWKIDCADGQLTHWTHDDLREFLLDWYPRMGGSDEEAPDAVPDAVTAFVRFLGARDLLSGADAEALAATVERLRDRFLEAAQAGRKRKRP
jgi:hypothetical protein